MLERFVELEESLRSTIGLLDIAFPSLSAEEWVILKELCLILEPFENATKCVSGEQYISASLVIVLTRGLLNVCDKFLIDNFNILSIDIINCLQNGIRSRLGNIEYSNTLAISTFLDPRFKEFGFKNIDAVEKIKKTVIAALTENINNNNKTNETILETQTPIESDIASSAPPHNNGSANKSKLYSLWASLDESVSNFRPKHTGNSRAIMEVQRYVEDEVLGRNFPGDLSLNMLAEIIDPLINSGARNKLMQKVI
ncbi:unnamed protein product [Psylliodes chrysocephalus]|uniref:Uncharacterized protein n=1 Tax=Psylliodes chrysocephalus TaxID=3402493 RepID=A0A9P0CMX4_9CUCU|nr:unnamed protein product [Psylliodes chrysocephala]